MNSIRPLSRYLALAFGGSFVIASASVYAQSTQQTSQPEAQKQERIEVTGSNIRRNQAETASPVQTITREEIEKSGKASVAELLQTLAIDNQGSVPTTFGAGFASGASGISLRGLGAASTLVLVNGRRIAPYGLADDGQKVFADLNMIPSEAIERVEIVKDGASSIYGSDAIAGVVNVILRKDFSGTTGKLTVGQSRYGDGKEARAAVTTGFGNLDTDKYNILVNIELAKKDRILYKDRAGRGAIGRNDLRDLGFDAQTGFGGTGAILDNNLAASAINGNVRNPITGPLDPVTGDPTNPNYLNYYNRGNLNGADFTRTFPGAACNNFTNHPQGDPLGGCLIDGPQVYGELQPSQKSANFFTRGTFLISADTQGYLELNLYKNQSESTGTPSGVSGSVGYPGGPVSNASTALGAAHPDNPYFGTAARLRYLAADVGPRISNVDSTFTRLVTGIKGAYANWDYDSALLFSESKVSNERTGFLQRDVMRALLNPTAANVAIATANSPAYAALPTGTYWRIAENAGLNSAALYAALSPKISNDAKSRTIQIDFKGTRELMQLDGGALGLALGTEFRRESIKLEPTSGTDKGNIVGLGYSAYDGARTVTAAFAELAAPITKQIELSAALRVDHYSDVGNSVTPKVGFKFTPVKEFALRATYAQGFRAPSSAENGKGGLAAFSTAADPLRCGLGVTSACSPGTIAIITSPNPNLKPEKSKSYTLGLIFDPLPNTSVSLDAWEINRKNEINQEQTDAAILAGHVSRDPSTATAIPGDPGGITAVLANYVNSASTKVQGVDLDLRQRFGLAESGRLTFDAKWTHLFKWVRTEQDGTSRDFAGTHGNCDVTNCIGTPADRVNFSTTWDRGPLSLTAQVNYRGELKNINFKDDPAGCANTYADGTEAPAGCKIKSFTTVDLNVRWKYNDKLEVFGNILNLFDKVAPLDPLTYGQQSFNPLDYSGAVGRYFSLGAKYKF